MKRIRVEKNKNYTTISNVFLLDKRLSLKAKGFLAMIMSLKDNWDFTIEGFVKITKEGEAAIYTAIKELKDFGYCREEKIRDEKKRIVGNEYTFYEEPKTKSVDNQLDCENQDLGFLNQANQGQISTTNNNTNNKVLNEIKEKEDKSSQKKKFKKPTIEEIQAYVSEKGYHIDAESFFSFYESKGWKVGKTPMTSWKSACVTWERKYLEQHPNAKTKQTHHNANNDEMVINGQIYK